jgi:simple sugar transport system permease protein
MLRTRLLRSLAGLTVPALAVSAALAIGAVMMLLLGADPIEGYRALISGPVGGADELADTALRSMSLLLVCVSSDHAMNRWDVPCFTNRKTLLRW